MLGIATFASPCLNKVCKPLVAMCIHTVLILLEYNDPAMIYSYNPSMTLSKQERCWNTRSFRHISVIDNLMR